MYYVEFINYLTKDNTNALLVCLILLIYSVISEVLSRTHDNKYGEGTFYVFFPILREYTIYKIFLGEIKATILVFVYIIPVVLHFVNPESFIIINIIWTMDIINLLLTVYILILFLIYIIKSRLLQK